MAPAASFCHCGIPSTATHQLSLLPLVEPAYWAVSVGPSITTLAFRDSASDGVVWCKTDRTACLELGWNVKDLRRLQHKLWDNVQDRNEDLRIKMLQWYRPYEKENFGRTDGTEYDLYWTSSRLMSRMHIMRILMNTQQKDFPAGSGCSTSSFNFRARLPVSFTTHHDTGPNKRFKTIKVWYQGSHYSWHHQQEHQKSRNPICPSRLLI